MTRGRKKDLTIPPTRALTQQRDYRARKAHYVSELEERCRQMEEDNNKLRQEIDSLKAGLPITTIYSPQMVAASSQLMHSLSETSSSLQRFQQLAFAEDHFHLPTPPNGPNSHPTPDSVPNRLYPAFFPSPAPSSPFSETSRLADKDSNHPRHDETPHPSNSLSKILCPPDPSEYTPSFAPHSPAVSPASTRPYARQESMETDDNGDSDSDMSTSSTKHRAPGSHQSYHSR